MKRLLFLSLSALHAWGACHVITPAGSGNNSGSDWSNACNGFSGNCSTTSGMVRGDSYYLGKGNYSAPTLSRANSGTTTITIKSPTDADNCTATGYVSATHKGQADMGGSMFISSDYWILNGQYGTETPVTGKGTYGMKVHWTGGTSEMEIACSGGCTGTTFKYMEIEGSNGADTGCDVGIRILGYNQTPDTHDVLLDHLYIYKSNNNVGFQIMNHVTLSNSILSENWSTASCHGENAALNGPDDLTIKNNRFINCVGTGCIATPSSLHLAMTNLEIYGNIFYDNGRSGTCPGSFDCPGNGMIAIIDSVNVTGLKVYNNTVANWITGHTSGSTLTFFSTASAGTISGTVEFKNNLFYNNVTTDVGNSGTCSSNAFYSTTRSSSACTNDQTGGSGNPFVSSSTGNFRLASDTSAWASLASPYNIDPDGTTRSSSRGAFQLNAGGSSAPTVTTSAVTSISTTSATGNGNVTSDGGSTVTSRGVCWSTSAGPTLSGSCAAAGAGGTGTFTASMTGQTSNTFYFVAAYATNGVGTSYGSDVTFTTSTGGASSTSNAGMSGAVSVGGKASIR